MVEHFLPVRPCFLVKSSSSTCSSAPQALEAQEQEKDKLRPPQQNPSPVPGNQRAGSPRSDRTLTPEPQGSPSPAASSPDLTTTNTNSSTPPPPAPDQDQVADTSSINGDPVECRAPVNGGAEPVTPSKGVCQQTLEVTPLYRTSALLMGQSVLQSMTGDVTLISGY